MNSMVTSLLRRNYGLKRLAAALQYRKFSGKQCIKSNTLKFAYKKFE